PLGELDRVAVAVQGRQHGTRHARKAARLANAEIISDVVPEKPHHHEIRLERRADLKKLGQFLTRVVAGDRRVPDLPVDIRSPPAKPLLEKVRIRVLVDGAMPEGDRVAEDEDPKGVRMLAEAVLTVVAELELIDSDRHSSKPPHVSRSKPLDPHRIGQEESRHALQPLPRQPGPQLNTGCTSHQRQNGREGGEAGQPDARSPRRGHLTADSQVRLASGRNRLKRHLTSAYTASTPAVQ